MNQTLAISRPAYQGRELAVTYAMPIERNEIERQRNTIMKEQADIAAFQAGQAMFRKPVDARVNLLVTEK